MLCCVKAISPHAGVVHRYECSCPAEARQHYNELLSERSPLCRPLYVELQIENEVVAAGHFSPLHLKQAAFSGPLF